MVKCRHVQMDTHMKRECGNEHVTKRGRLWCWEKSRWGLLGALRKTWGEIINDLIISKLIEWSVCVCVGSNHFCCYHSNDPKPKPCFLLKCLCLCEIHLDLIASPPLPISWKYDPVHIQCYNAFFFLDPHIL